MSRADARPSRSFPEPVRGTLIYIIGTYPLLTTTFIDREIMALRGSGVDVHVIALRRPSAETPLSSEQIELGRGVTYILPVSVRRLLTSHAYFGLRHPLRYLRTLIYLITRSHPSIGTRTKTVLHFGEAVLAAFEARMMAGDEFHAHFADRAATVALVAGGLLDKPYSLSIHAGADIFVEPVLLREKIQGARRVVTCTSHNLDHVVSHAGEDLRHKIVHVPHGLDLSRFDPGAHASIDPPVILAVGQLAERKGFSHLVRACRRLADEGYRFVCRLLGDGPQREHLERMVEHLALGDVVQLYGARPHEEVLEHYRRAALFVLPCIRTTTGDVDGIPNVLAEAMASGLAVVSSDMPAIRELVVHGGAGLLVPPGDEEALVAAVRTLLDDPDLRRSLGARGRRAVEEGFDVERNVRRFATEMWPDWFAYAEERVDA